MLRMAEIVLKTTDVLGCPHPLERSVPVRKFTLLALFVLTISLLPVRSALAVAPTVSSFDPTSGQVGTAVVISGSAFTGSTQVSFNGTVAAFTVDSDTTISTTVPAGATSGPITVTNPDGPGVSGSSFTVTPTPEPAPRIHDFSPRRGPVGTQVVILGSHLVDVVDVRLRGESVSFQEVSASRVRFRVPRGAKSGRITVETETGTDTSGSRFAVRKDRHRSVLEFKLNSHLVATGRVSVPDGTRMCRSERRVSIQQRRDGSWRAVRSTRTRPRGEYRVSIPDVAGTYRAVVGRKSNLTDLCLSDESSSRRHRHPTGGGDGNGNGGGGAGCTPGYSPCLVYHGGADYDCAGGSGDGPYYTRPGVVYRVSGSDPYDLDSDSDGRGCE